MAATATQVVAFNAIQITGLIGALVIILTALCSGSIRRLPTWYLVLCSGAVYSLSMLLLAMAHAQFGPSPNFVLCLIQGAFIYASPIWFMASGCAFALQFHLTVLYYVKQYSGKINKSSKWLSILPVTLFAGMAVTLLITGSLQPEIVERDPEQFYCHFKSNLGVYCVSGFSTIFAVISVTLEYQSGKLLYQHWKISSDLYRRSNGTVSIGVMVRLAGFSLISVLSVATCALYMIPSITNFDNIIIYNAFLCNVDVLVLGLNMSIIRVWMFWKRKKSTQTAEIRVEVQVQGSEVTV